MKPVEGGAGGLTQSSLRGMEHFERPRPSRFIPFPGFPRMRQNLESFFMVCARSGLEACENKINIHHLKYSALLYYIKVNVFHRLVTLIYFILFFAVFGIPSHCCELSLHKETITHRYLFTPSLLTRVFGCFTSLRLDSPLALQPQCS